MEHKEFVRELLYEADDRALAKQLKSGNVQNGSSRNPPPVALTGIVY